MSKHPCSSWRDREWVQLSSACPWTTALGVLGDGEKLPALQLLDPPPHPHALLLASHSLRSISRGSTTSSLNSKSVILDLVCSGSKYTFFSSEAVFLPFGLALDFLPRKKGCHGHHMSQCGPKPQGLIKSDAGKERDHQRPDCSGQLSGQSKRS